jgi:hypothetical protein
LDRSRATTPALAEAAARNEVERLRQELAAKQTQLDAALSAQAPGVASAAAAPVGATDAASPPVKPLLAWLAGAVALLMLGGGFWLGYATLARRVRHKFGGIKVY